jgi:hypothetical protein
MGFKQVVVAQWFQATARTITRTQEHKNTRIQEHKNTRTSSHERVCVQSLQPPCEFSNLDVKPLSLVP